MKNYSSQIKILISQMTLREKIAQTAQTVAGYRCFTRQGESFILNNDFKAFVSDYGAMGAISNILRADAFTKHGWGEGIEPRHRVKVANQIQHYIMKNARLPIPTLIEVEANHCVHALGSTVFPTNLGMACSFDTELYSQIMQSVGEEIKLSGNHMGFVTMLDMARDPRWGRCEELFSEDPYLAAALTESGVKGFKKSGSLICCKHFCGAGDGFGGINTAEVNLGVREIHDIHLPAAQKAVEAGADVVMAAYNTVDGIPCHVNPYLLKDVLRGELGFDGIILSDGFAVSRVIDQMGYDKVSGAARVLKSGIDLSLADSGAYLYLEDAVKQGLVKESLLDEAVEHILEKKAQLGLFDDPYASEDKKLQIFLDSGKQKELAYRAATESAVLLKNNGILPLSKDKKIALIGAHAENAYHMLGSYTPYVKPNTKTIADAFEGSFDKADFIRGWDFFGKDESEFEKAIAIAKDSDAVIVTLGGTSAGLLGGELKFDEKTGAVIGSKIFMDCGEGVDRSELILPGNQLKLLRLLKETEKPVIAILIQGRPYEITEANELSDAVIAAFYPGEEGGQALADIILGKVNPSGKLSVSIPYHSSCLPAYYNRLVDEEVSVAADWIVNTYCDHNKRILYPFGYGLSYSSFEYSNLCINQRSATEYEVTVDVENTSDTDGKETAQLYIHASGCSVRRRLRELKGFKKLALGAHEKKTISFMLGYEELKVFSARNRYEIEDCHVDIFVGGGCDINSPIGTGNILKASIDIKN